MAWELTLDGTTYHHLGLSSLKRSASIMEDGNGGWTMNGHYRRSIIGTLYNYSFVIYQLGDQYAAEYDACYQVLTSPQDTHQIVLPYGQGSISLTAYITGVDDSLRWEDENGRLWGAMQVKFQAQAPSRIASGV